MSTPAAGRPEARYGSPRSPKAPSGLLGKIIAIVSVIVLIAFILVFARFIMNRDDRSVTVEMISHERIDDQTMRLWVDVTREDTTVPSYCIVTSLNYGMAEVGRREFLIEPGGDHIQRFEVDIPSRDLPVSGGV